MEAEQIKWKQSEALKLKVGDKIKVQNNMMRMYVVIAKTTKTQAITAPYNDAGCTMRFKLEITPDGTCRILPHTKHNYTSYTVAR